MADERTRYSDAELEEFKQLILKKLIKCDCLNSIIQIVGIVNTF